MARSLSTGALVVALSAHASAEPEAHVASGADLVGGVATAPFYSDNLPQATGHGLVFVARASWHDARGHGFGLAVPVVSINVRQPAGSYVNEAAWGNPLVWAERRWKLGRSALGRFEGWARLGVAVPLAEFGPPHLLYENRALAIADAISGWLDRELFASGLAPVPLTLGSSLDHGVLHVETLVKLVPMLRIHDASLESDKPRTLAFFAVAGTGATLWPLRAFGFGAHAYLAIDAAPQADSPRARTFQPVVRPGLTFRVGERLELQTDGAIPIAGPLGGESFGIGVRATAVW